MMSGDGEFNDCEEEKVSVPSQAKRQVRSFVETTCHTPRYLVVTCKGTTCWAT